MKYIFPRQFGLHNVFTSTVDNRETTQPFKDYLLREDEIAKAGKAKKSRRNPETTSEGNAPLVNKTKLPKRLRGKAFELSRQLQKRHQRCSYTALIQHYCSVEVFFSRFVLLIEPLK
jgi:telomerase reverse transcriptase